MKNLHDSRKEMSSISSPFPLRTIINRPENATQIILLLHGLNERGYRLYRKLLPHLPQDALILSPDAPFPLPRVKSDRIDYGYAWYFYDRFSRTYLINQDFARGLLKGLIKEHNPHQLPLTIIGFSQGGYLAPLVGIDLPETRLVIGIGCEFKSTLIKERPHYSLVAIHGKEDDIIPLADAQREKEHLKNNGIECEFFEIPETGHEVNQVMGQQVKQILESYGKRSS